MAPVLVPQQEQPEQPQQEQRFSGGAGAHIFHGASCPPEMPGGDWVSLPFPAEVEKMAEPVPGRALSLSKGRANNNRRAPKVRPRCAATFLWSLTMYTRLISWDNLLLAYRKASKGKRGQPNVAAFEHDLEDNLWQLQSELGSKTYCPGPYTSFFIHEPKRRLISAAPVRDRVVHHALCNLIEPILDHNFIADSYANRTGKGTHRALDRCQEFARRYRYGAKNQRPRCTVAD
jgi:hypothetical protein